uniref:RILP-like protein 2 n=1 Tax=Cercocebus atys TaxID=9531 RepID=A0A2K5LGA2_CERAT
MEEPPVREEEEEEGEEDDERDETEDEERDEAGPEGALGKSPFQLTAEDVYDISYLLGRELMALGSDPRVTQLQFKVVRVLEMLEALVNEGSLALEELKMERDNLRKEVEGLRRQDPPTSGEVSDLEPNKYGVDLTDLPTDRFTLREERNKLSRAPWVVQEELACYKSGLIPPREGPGGRREKDAVVTRANNAGRNKEEKTIIKKLFFFRSGKQT